MRGGAEACVALALSTQGATIHARYRNVLVRVDYVRAGTTSARDEAPTVAVTASVVAALSARWCGGR